MSIIFISGSDSDIVSTSLSPHSEDGAIRSADFNLLPVNPAAPIIVSQPIQNIAQYTWYRGDTTGSSERAYQQVDFISNTVRMIEGTAFSWDVIAIDPSNINNYNDDSNLRYLWRKDGAPIYQLASINSKAAYIETSSCTPELNGEYVVEISNRFGTVTSQPLQLEVIRPLDYPLFYRNLLFNGDAEQGLDGWIADDNITTKPFVDSVWLNQNFGSILIGNRYKPDPYEIDEFHFGSSQNWLNFPATFYGGAYVADQRKIPANLIPSDEITDPGVYFPSPSYIDKHNQNLSDKLIGLAEEKPKWYFTRDRIKFKKFGGQARATFYQDVDLRDASDFIDGRAYGITQTYMQFFGYIGAGISRYMFKVSNLFGSVTESVNHFILDYEDLIGTLDTGSSAWSRLLVPNSTIEVYPVIDDKTQVDIEYYDNDDVLLKRSTILGPDATDLWAVKEKFYLPSTLMPILKCVISNNNDVTVFGQKYTNTSNIHDITAAVTPTTDKNLEWVITGSYALELNNIIKQAAMRDAGAAAMFGFEHNEILPKTTAYARIRVTFEHLSDAVDDQSPEYKDWAQQDIYYQLWDQRTGNSVRPFAYGNPRCGITSMKFVLHPNEIKISSDYATYFLPAQSVWANSKKRIFEGIWDSTSALRYNFIGSTLPILPPDTGSVSGGIPVLPTL